MVSFGTTKGIVLLGCKSSQNNSFCFVETPFQVPGRGFLALLGPDCHWLGQSYHLMSWAKIWGVNGQSMARKKFNQFFWCETKFLYLFHNPFLLLVVVSFVQIHHLHSCIFTTTIKFLHIGFCCGEG